MVRPYVAFGTVCVGECWTVGSAMPSLVNDHRNSTLVSGQSDKRLWKGKIGERSSFIHLFVSLVGRIQTQAYCIKTSIILCSDVSGCNAQSFNKRFPVL